MGYKLPQQATSTHLNRSVFMQISSDQSFSFPLVLFCDFFFLVVEVCIHFRLCTFLDKMAVLVCTVVNCCAFTLIGCGSYIYRIWKRIKNNKCCISVLLHMSYCVNVLIRYITSFYTLVTHLHDQMLYLLFSLQCSSSA